MTSVQDRYDSLFLSILQNEGPKPVEKFLDIVFSFLYRRTDFFITMKTPRDSQGFPPGVSQQLVSKAMSIYANKAEKDAIRRQKLAEKKEIQHKNETPPETVHSVARTEEVVSASVASNVDDSTSLSATSQPCPEQSATADALSPEKNERETSQEQRRSSVGDESKEAKKPDKPLEVDENDPDLERLQASFQDNPLSHNGAIRDKYLWSQSITDLDVRIQVPNGVRKGKNVKVDIARRHLVVKFRGDDGEWSTPVNEDLCWDVNKEESIWSLDPGKYIHVNLEKVQERWWEAVLVSEPRISVRKIDPSRPITDLDDESQAKIEEMMYNERQKKMGLPQSHEQKMEGMLKKAWDAEGSPFKGQPFDPSKVNLTSNMNPDFNP